MRKVATPLALAVLAGALACSGGSDSPGGPSPVTTTTTTTLPALFTASGTGNTVFDMPSRVQRVRIQGRFEGRSTNFIIRIGGRLVVNELLGTSWGPTTYDGVHLTNGGGVVEITNSTEVAWTFTEVR